MTVDFLATGQIDHLAPTIDHDSESAIHLSNNPVYHEKTKHIEVWFHHIWELVMEKKLEIRKIDTEVNIADFLMKPLLRQCFRTLKTKMRLQQETEQKKTKRGAEGKLKPTESDEPARQNQ